MKLLIVEYFRSGLDPVLLSWKNPVSPQRGIVDGGDSGRRV